MAKAKKKPELPLTDRRKRKSGDPAPPSTRRKRPPPLPPREPPPPPDPDDDGETPLSPTEHLFVREMLVRDNAARAYRIACPTTGFRNCQRNASEMAHRPHVVEAIDQLRREQCTRLELDADEALQLAIDIGTVPINVFFDEYGNPLPPQRLPDQYARLVQSVKVCREHRSTQQNGTINTVITNTVLNYVLPDRVRAIALVHDALGLSKGPPPLEMLVMALRHMHGPEFTDAVLREAAGIATAAHDKDQRQQRVGGANTNIPPPPNPPPAP